MANRDTPSEPDDLDFDLSDLDADLDDLVADPGDTDEPARSADALDRDLESLLAGDPAPEAPPEPIEDGDDVDGEEPADEPEGDSGEALDPEPAAPPETELEDDFVEMDGSPDDEEIHLDDLDEPLPEAEEDDRPDQDEPAEEERPEPGPEPTDEEPIPDPEEPVRPAGDLSAAEAAAERRRQRRQPQAESPSASQDEDELDVVFDDEPLVVFDDDDDFSPAPDATAPRGAETDLPPAPDAETEPLEEEREAVADELDIADEEQIADHQVVADGEDIADDDPAARLATLAADLEIAKDDELSLEEIPDIEPGTATAPLDEIEPDLGDEPELDPVLDDALEVEAALDDELEVEAALDDELEVELGRGDGELGDLAGTPDEDGLGDGEPAKPEPEPAPRKLEEDASRTAIAADIDAGAPVDPVADGSETAAATDVGDDPDAPPPGEEAAAAPDPTDRGLRLIPRWKPHEWAGAASVLAACLIALAMLVKTVTSFAKETLERAPEEPAKEVPAAIRGELVVLESVDCFWRDAQKGDRVKEGHLILPVVELQAASGDGFIQVVFRDGSGETRGDAYTFAVRGGAFADGGEVIALGTEGMENEVQFADYRADTAAAWGHRWSVEVKESPERESWERIAFFELPPIRR